MVIKINIHNEIVWPIMIFLLLKYFGVSGPIMFLISVAWLIYISVRDNRVRITIPRIHGFSLYCTFIVIAIVIGLMMNDTRDVAKDIFYSFPTIVMIMIGYLYNKYDNGKSVTKTLYLTGTIITLISFVNLAMNFSTMSNMGLLRTIMGQQVYETTFIFAIMLSEKIIGKKVIFSNITDWLMIFLMLLKSIISLGRTELIVTIIIVVVVLLLNIYFSEFKFNSILTLTVVATVMLVVGLTVYTSLPENIRNQFMDKLVYSLEEVDSDVQYDSTIEAMQHWRAYEVSCAIKQWEESNFFTELFGAGFGEYIKIEYIPHNFNDQMVKNNSIALLHNTYYTLLVKGGVLGVIAIIWLYLSNAVVVFKRRYKKYAYEISAMCVITIGMMIFTYATRGIFSQSVEFVWPFMIGWLNGKIRDDVSEQVIKQEKVKLKW